MSGHQLGNEFDAFFRQIELGANIATRDLENRSFGGM